MPCTSRPVMQWHDSLFSKTNTMPDVIRGDLYDYPKYYDLLFGSDWKAEFDFLRLCLEKHAGQIGRASCRERV